MALAWLDLVGIDRGALHFAIDTGTSRYYQLRIGRGHGKREGFDWVDDVYLTTPIHANDAGGSLLPATREVAVPASRLDAGPAYVQLVSFKTPDGRAPAFSRVIPLPANAQALGGRMTKLSSPLPVSASMTSAQTPFQTPRRIPCVESPDQLAHQASLDDLIAGIVKLAAPAVLQALGSAPNGSPAGGGGASGAASSPVTGVVTFLLKSLLAGLNAPAAPTNGPATPNPTPARATSLSTAPPAQSLGTALRNENRFAAARRTEWSQPFIFGIDDALIGALAGPILNVLPQLINAANQSRLQTQQNDNKLISDALAEVNKRMLMERLIQAQASAPANSQNEIAQLRALLEQAATAQSAAPPTPAKAQSLSLSAAAAPARGTPAATPSQRAVLAFVTADPVEFNGAPHVVFVRNRDAELKVRFTVGDPVPKTALPQAILTLTLKGSHKPADWVTTTAKLHDVAPNGVVTITVSQRDLARLPANRKIPVVAELRWPASKGGTTYSATGATDIVLVDTYFVRERRGLVGEERELVDMAQYRAFWNKVWEAPTLDALAATDGRKKSLWALDVTARYLVLLTSRDDANGVMETKLKAAPTDPDALTLTVAGRLKGGVELSITELNKLRALWEDQEPLDADHLAALRSEAIAHANSAEFITNLKMKGRAGERGMMWIVPVFQMVEFALSHVQKIDDAGQVVAVADETVQFPMPVAARVLGLKSA